MKYIVKCSYCDNTYAVNVSKHEMTFICNSCGAANGMGNVIERIPTWKSLVKGNRNEAVTDADISGIKSFDISDYKIENNWKKSLKNFGKAYAEELKKRFWIFTGEEDDPWYPELKDDDNKNIKN